MPFPIDNNQRDKNGNIIIFITREGEHIISRNSDLSDILHMVNSDSIKKVNIEFLLGNNTIIIHQSKITNLNIKVNRKSLVVINASKHSISNLNISSRFYDCYINIGNDFSCSSTNFILDEKSSIIIGNDCMFAGGIILRTSDGHAIIDNISKKIINPAKSIILKDHIWVGDRACILKGVKCNKNCIIGANSVVTRSFIEENCIIAGNPAKIIKTDINWSRLIPMRYLELNPEYQSSV